MEATPCGWSRVNEGGGEDWEVMGAGHARPCGLHGDFILQVVQQAEVSPCICQVPEPTAFILLLMSIYFM